MSTTDITWEGMIRLLDPQQPIPKQSKAEGAIEFWREWDAGRQRAVWGKRYIANDKYDLRAFNSAEIEWLMQLSSANVGNTYRRASFEQEGTKLAQPASTTIKTLDCGPTLDDWLRTTVVLNGRPQRHCFVQPESFLRLAQQILLALDRVHACHFVHCDLHPGNVTLPMWMLDATADKARLVPRWDNITLIDFGYSVDARRPPKTTLPIQHEGQGVRMSRHLQGILREVETEAKKLLKAGESWVNVYLDPEWWQPLDVSPLDAFRRLDWREDLYQLGHMLADIRDGVGHAKHLEGRTIRGAQAVKAVDQMVNELPEQLMQLGLGAEKPAHRPHLAIVESIEKLLIESKGRGAGCPDEFLLLKTTFDSNGDITPAPKPSSDRKHPDKPAAGETPLGKDLQQASAPPWAKYTPDLPLPAMKPLRVASPAGWQFVVAAAPVTWRQWRAASQHNPDLFRPGLLGKPGELPETMLDCAVTGVSHADCLAYLDTINHLSGAYVAGEPAHFRLPTPAEWALLIASDHDAPTPGQKTDVASKPVDQWAPNAHGMAGLRHHLLQWAAAPENGGWAQVRGGCAAQTGSQPHADPVDEYPTDHRSPFITLRVVRHVLLVGTTA